MRSLYYRLADIQKTLKFKRALLQTHSSFPLRSGDIEFYVDGAEAMQSVAEAISTARRKIHIMDWRMDLDITLVRTPHPLQSKKLVDLLAAAAIRGVQVSVILYNSPWFSHLTDNRKTAKILNKLHPNITCICKHWSLIYSNHEKLVIVDNKVALLGGVDLCLGRYDNIFHHITPMVRDAPNGALLFPPADYNNIQIPKTNRFQYPRMPWHDVHCKVDGEIIMDLQQHFLQRWQFYGGEMQTAPAQKKKGGVSMRFCQSSCKLSGGKNECSIYGEMLKLVRKAKRFIYIEQQYFLSNSGKRNISNKIGREIAKKIIEAAKKDEKFFVIIVLPLFSEGELKHKSVRKMAEYTRLALYDGVGGIVSTLQKNGIDDWQKYLSVNNLYNVGWCEKLGVTLSQIYVHSKLMIIDDEFMLLGSANINDRSLRGDRDTEIAISIEENEKVKLVFDKTEVLGGKEISDLRKRLWKEHLGISDNLETLVEDPFTCYDELWKKIAQDNRDILEQVFPLFPRNAFTKYIDTELHTHPKAVENRIPMLLKLQGHLVKNAQLFGSKEHQRSYGLTAIVT
ncbi:phospholipase D, putative [Entamoeba invadens IP1]|uniref:phospholipase D n=1 Tax=Entamoeba invadens IP1 TaxID=370355 RepID=L7FM17_ENTIV|nr:phospholipase D, putative [Entamoeba invadens IP1]ELP88559.1 phospholipase D, putative [Entamoeba invadens IP1]|eukprot:XP_004255330.1 phospholipase D, putative [Entamoeba invadens IP1]